ncbi:MAG: hypothetical protein DRN71_00350 [Candidatus Nanohalarchaeota archaeon]|nr:MAG: hypothetical protein DRN71_00350 [Candidatus Nanohaloarchaeota archaeon]
MKQTGHNNKPIHDRQRNKLGILAQYNFRKTKIPDVLVLISAGAIISYLSTAKDLGITEYLTQNTEQITFLITFSQIYVEFYDALPIKLKALFSTMKYSFASSLFNFILITLLIGTASHYLIDILIDFSQWKYLMYGLGFFLIAYILRALVVRILINHDLEEKDEHFLEAMCAKGLTPTVMLAVIHTDPAFTNIVVGDIFSSILITSILIYLIDKNKFTSISEIIYKKLGQHKNKEPSYNREEDNEDDNEPPKQTSFKEDIKIISKAV